MKKLTCTTVVLLITVLLMCIQAGALSGEGITAEAAVLIDAQTGQILYQKNMNQRMYPASITKIMTGLLAMEACDPGDILNVSESAVNLPRNTSHIALTGGERIRLDDAMYALMLPSANDAANALAEHVAGSQESFARLMNRRAEEIGAVNTNFVNAHGLPDESHYTTAYDMALITMEASKNQRFMQYFGTGRYTMARTNLQPEQRSFTNQQYMLLPGMWVYNPDVIGGKVGYTQESRHTMSTIAARDGRTLICVVLSCGPDEKFYDTQALLDYGFDSFVEYTIPKSQLTASTVPIEEAGTALGYAAFHTDEDVHILLHKGIDPEDIAYIYDYPSMFSVDSPIEGSLVLEVVNNQVETLPEMLMRVSLTPEITMLGPLDAEPEMTPSANGGTLVKGLHLASVAVTATVVIFLVVMLLHIRAQRAAQKRRRKRREDRVARIRAGRMGL